MQIDTLRCALPFLETFAGAVEVGVVTTVSTTASCAIPVLGCVSSVGAVTVAVRLLEFVMVRTIMIALLSFRVLWVCELHTLLHHAPEIAS